MESTYLNSDMCKFESSQKDESRWQSTDSSKAYRNTSAFKCIYDVIHLFDVIAVLASTIVYDRGVQPAARGPNAIQQSGFLCRSLVPDSLCETKARPAVSSV